MNLNALYVVGAAFLSIAFILTIYSIRVKDGTKRREMWLAFGIQFITIGLILIPAYFGGIVFTIIIAGIATASLIEYLNIQRDRLPFLLKGVCVALGLIIFGLAHFYSYAAVYLSIPLSVVVLLTMSLFYRNEHRVIHAIAPALLGLLYVSVFCSHLVLIRKMDRGFLVVFFMYGISEINDSFAFVLGRFLGKKKIFPNISPNKTYAGFFSGVLAACSVAAVINLFVTKFAPYYAAAAAGVIICFTVAGDLVSSKIKRALQVKDFSQRIPRIGGVLDVYDTLIFISPFVFFLSMVMGR